MLASYLIHKLEIADTGFEPVTSLPRDNYANHGDHVITTFHASRYIPCVAHCCNNSWT